MRSTIFVIGTRAQIVKIAPVLRIAVQSNLQHRVWFTGQHRESVADLVRDFELRSEFVLPTDHAERSSILRLLVWIPMTLVRCFRYVSLHKKQSSSRPLVVVHGDTLSTWLGALAGRCAGGEIVHLESGLSSGHWADPFPEELLRRMTFRLTHYALCPNRAASANMERFPNCTVVDTKENTLLDCVRFAVDKGVVISGSADDYFVASIHRFQNIYDRKTLQMIVDEMLQAAELGIVHFIMHPPTELRLKKYALMDALKQHDGIVSHARKPYTEFLSLIGRSRAVFSDGGSNQEELSYLGVPTILYRERSERPDGLQQNIALRSSLRGSMRSVIESGKLDALRRPSRLDSDVQPSRVTIDALTQWAADPSG